MTYFDRNEPVNDIFEQIYFYKPDWNREFWTFSPKMTYFDQIDPINDTFDQIYVHKPDWNYF